MPNWAYGNVEVTGERNGLLQFVLRFSGHETGQHHDKYFPSSFINTSKVDVIVDIVKRTQNKAVATVVLPATFAWSAYKCLIKGYPQAHPDKFISLSDACIEDQVRAHIQTEEPGLYFEEDIVADETGEVKNSFMQLKTARCPKCGNEQGVASFMDLDELECIECGCGGLEMKEEES